MHLFVFTALLTGISISAACSRQVNKIPEPMENLSSFDTATFGTGCFWCTEAIFRELKGVKSVTPGYSGGHIKNPAYREVCEGTTGHAEVVQIIFDTSLINFRELLDVFWEVHDPTSLNRQGNDAGTQYRSAIFYHSPEQKKIAEEYKSQLEKSKVFPLPVVTEITAFSAFYPAEDYHKDYYSNNQSVPYCRYVIAPKLDKFRKSFKEQLK
jgi:peptide-methionine (S)-S-oxide reductase